MHWLEKSFETAIELLMSGYLNSTCSESDYLKRVWVLIDHCFDQSNVDVTTYAIADLKRFWKIFNEILL